jgi:hypothetical protein
MICCLLRALIIWCINENSDIICLLSCLNLKKVVIKKKAQPMVLQTRENWVLGKSLAARIPNLAQLGEQWTQDCALCFGFQVELRSEFQGGGLGICIFSVYSGDCGVQARSELSACKHFFRWSRQGWGMWVLISRSRNAYTGEDFRSKRPCTALGQK